jgi:SAM-dependent methyltransferase
LCSFDNTASPAMSYSVGAWHLKDCGKCGLVYLENPPAYNALQDQWAWEKTSSAERERRRSAEPFVQRLSEFVGYLRHKVFKRDKLSPLARRYFAPGAVVDVGCGDGKWLQRVGELGFVPSGVEVSDALAKEASAKAAKFGGRVVAGNAVDGLEQFTDSTFTGAILISFLEHESNPLALLVKLRRKLVAGGRMIVKVPNFGSWNRFFRGARWCGLRFPDHVNYFTPRTLREIIRRAGFKIVRFSLKDRFPFSDNMWAVCQSA